MVAEKGPRREVDRTLLLVTLLLLAIGLIMVFSASFIAAEETQGDPYYFLKRQALWVGIGLCAMLFLSLLHYKKLKRLSLIIILLNFALLGMIFTGFGSELGTEARRWLVLGPVILQPSEFSKLAFVIFTAAYMSSRSLNMRNFWAAVFIPLTMVGAAFFLIQYQPDMGTALIVVAASVLVIFLAGAPVHQFAGLSLFVMPVFIYFTIKQDYRVQRLFTFFDPWADSSGYGYQIIQSLYALGPGHIFGAGLGRSRQKLFYLPEPQNDFIFAIIGEELGFIGAVTVILLYTIFVWRGFKIAQKAPDLFGSLLAGGITFIIALQVLINVAVVTGSVPVTGVNLPLISAGGSSVFFTLAGIGILMNISRHSRTLEQSQGRA